jgi:2'-5' RNA ligase
LDLDEVLLEASARIRDRLARSRHAPKDARFTQAEKMHVTLKFLGSIDAAQAQTIASGLEPLATRAPPLTLQALDAFPFPSRARVIVLTLEDDGTLRTLATAIEEYAEALGIERETREFRAHLTLARLREPSDVRTWLGPIDAVHGAAAALTLYESTGGHYKSLASFPFG